MIHLSAVQTLQFDTESEYQANKPKIQTLAHQTGASVEWKDAEYTAVLTAQQELKQL